MKKFLIAIAFLSLLSSAALADTHDAALCGRPPDYCTWEESRDGKCPCSGFGGEMINRQVTNEFSKFTDLAMTGFYYGLLPISLVVGMKLVGAFISPGDDGPPQPPNPLDGDDFS